MLISIRLNNLHQILECDISVEQESQLLKQAKRKCIKSRNQLICKHLSVITTLSKMVVELDQTIDISDACSEIVVEFINCITTPIQSNMRLFLYAFPHIINRLLKIYPNLNLGFWIVKNYYCSLVYAMLYDLLDAQNTTKEAQESR